MSHDHTLEYLLKKDQEGNLMGNVLSMPAVTANGRNKDEVEKKLERATLSYFKMFETEHERILKGDTESRLEDSGYGIIVGTEKFKVTC